MNVRHITQFQIRLLSFTAQDRTRCLRPIKPSNGSAMAAPPRSMPETRVRAASKRRGQWNHRQTTRVSRWQDHKSGCASSTEARAFPPGRRSSWSQPHCRKKVVIHPLPNPMRPESPSPTRGSGFGNRKTAGRRRSEKIRCARRCAPRRDQFRPKVQTSSSHPRARIGFRADHTRGRLTIGQDREAAQRAPPDRD